jgi:GNAT superfamily N-acetyltransferase
MVSAEMIGMQISTSQLRLVKPADLASGTELSSVAGWNQTPEDWRMLLDLAPTGCFGVEADGRLVATATLLCYRQRLAWIGMVLTHPEYRGRGFARRLVAAALDRADSLGIETVKLDATEQGRPLYESLGFQTEQPVERWFRPGPQESRTIERDPDSGTRSSPLSLSQALRDLDAQAFGTDRSVVLQELAQRNALHACPNAFLFARAGRTTEYLGPCVAADPAAARDIIPGAINTTGDTGWSWDLLPANKDAVALASELGFTRQRCLTRMARGKAPRGRDDLVYAIAGFELG